MQLRGEFVKKSLQYKSYNTACADSVSVALVIQHGNRMPPVTLLSVACLIDTVFSMVQQPLMAQCLLIFEASRSHSDIPHSLGLLWWGDQSVAETSS